MHIYIFDYIHCTLSLPDVRPRIGWEHNPQQSNSPTMPPRIPSSTSSWFHDGDVIETVMFWGIVIKGE